MYTFGYEPKKDNPYLPNWRAIGWILWSFYKKNTALRRHLIVVIISISSFSAIKIYIFVRVSSSIMSGEHMEEYKYND